MSYILSYTVKKNKKKKNDTGGEGTWKTVVAAAAAELLIFLNSRIKTELDSKTPNPLSPFTIKPSVKVSLGN